MLEPSSENNELRIARFATEETAERTRVVGLDEVGLEVARLELVHGWFELTGMFKDDYPGQREVDGRKLDITIGGEPRLTWETAGFEPTLHMPAHPASETQLIAFLADPHVKAVLDRWQIGFEASGATTEAAYTSGATAGSAFFDCLTNNPTTNCGTARTFPIGTCGGGTTPYRAQRVTRTSPFIEYFIDQCCPPVSGVSATDWFGRKSCPTTGSGAQASTCGTTGSTAACKGCAGYPASTGGTCALTYDDTHGQSQWCYNEALKTLTVLTTVGAGDITASISGFDGVNGGSVNTCANASVVLYANGTNMTFDGWSGACTGTGSCNLTMNTDKVVTANFCIGYGGDCSLGGACCGTLSCQGDGQQRCL